MFLSRVYATRPEIPKGAEQLYTKRGSLFIMDETDPGLKSRDIDADNPWDADGWNLTEQGRFIAKHGDKIANAFAKMAGTKIGATKPGSPAAAQYMPIPARNFTVVVQRRGISAPVGGGGLVGAGSSGDGDPD